MFDMAPTYIIEADDVLLAHQASESAGLDLSGYPFLQEIGKYAYCAVRQYHPTLTVLDALCS